MSMNDLIDFNALAEAKEMMKAKFPTMVEYYLEDSVNYIALIHEGMKASNVERIISPAHTLKSSSRQMGAQRVSALAKEIEALARDQTSAGTHDIHAFAPLVSALEAAFNETRTALPAQAA